MESGESDEKANHNAADDWIGLLKWRVDYYQRLQHDTLHNTMIMFGIASAILSAIGLVLVFLDSFVPDPTQHPVMSLCCSFALPLVFVVIVGGAIVYLFYGRRGYLYDMRMASDQKKKLLSLIAFVSCKKNNAPSERLSGKCAECGEYVRREPHLQNYKYGEDIMKELT